MSSAIADRVMAVTHKLVQQAMHGQWSDVPRTVEERRVLLDRLNATASATDQPWLVALRQAMVESDDAVAKIAAADSPETSLAAGPQDGVHPANTVDSTLAMIRQSR
ncbi:hypothetical protein [Povalibacter sp.]|uniref:hypothetical protein n=1 Tax=Povalibacter sp. TaxID=1962978 RepID=UPI002F427ECE